MLPQLPLKGTDIFSQEIGGRAGVLSKPLEIKGRCRWHPNDFEKKENKGE
jgi:hypothetical protein